MKIQDLSMSERPRERLIELGPGALSNGELIAILLRTGFGGASAVDVARQLLRSAGGSVAGLSRMSIDGLCRTPGIKANKAASVMAAFELGRRLFSEEAPGVRHPISNSGDVRDVMLPVMKALDHEECWVILLDRGNRHIGKIRISSGVGDSTAINAADIVRKALEKGAAGIILVHNHPSGNPMPSKEDVRQTEFLKEAAAACSIDMLDHIIMGDVSYYSFADGKVNY